MSGIPRAGGERREERVSCRTVQIPDPEGEGRVQGLAEVHWEGAGLLKWAWTFRDGKTG